ncbi:hypothetical protein ACFX2A_023100 [Malus domestica]
MATSHLLIEVNHMGVPLVCPCFGGGVVVSLCRHLRVSFQVLAMIMYLKKQSRRPAVKALKAVLSSTSAQREYLWLKRPAYFRSDSSGFWQIVYKSSTECK